MYDMDGHYNRDGEDGEVTPGIDLDNELNPDSNIEFLMLSNKD